MKKEISKRKKKGFTLIELLVVIIILAVIALIATPIVLNLVEDSKKSTGLSEANIILNEISKYCIAEEIKAQMDSDYPVICKMGLRPADVEKMVKLGKTEVLEIGYDYGLIFLKVKINGYTYSLKDNTMVEGDLDEIKAYAVGDLLKVKVSDSETQNIYVLEIIGDEIVGILDRKLPGEEVSWMSAEDYKSLTGGDIREDVNSNPEQLEKNLHEFGPVTATKELYERTSTWNKVSKKYLPSVEQIFKLTDYYREVEASGEKVNFGSKYHTDITEFYRANEDNDEIWRSNTLSEYREAMIAAGGEKYLLPEWATINLWSTGDDSSYYYWTSTPGETYYDDVDEYYYSYYSAFEVNGTTLDLHPVYYGYGEIRPVIHIDKSSILSKLDAPEYVNPEDVY